MTENVRKLCPIGTTMDNGTRFAGESPDTHTPMYLPRSLPSLKMTFNEAQAYVQENGMRLPSKAELDVVLTNRAQLGGFDMRDGYPHTFYWDAGEETNFVASGHRFSLKETDPVKPHVRAYVVPIN